VSLAPSVTVTFARQSAMDSRSQTVGLTAIRALAQTRRRHAIHIAR